MSWRPGTPPAPASYRAGHTSPVSPQQLSPSVTQGPFQQLGRDASSGPPRASQKCPWPQPGRWFARQPRHPPPAHRNLLGQGFSSDHLQGHPGQVPKFTGQTGKTHPWSSSVVVLNLKDLHLLQGAATEKAEGHSPTGKDSASFSPDLAPQPTPCCTRAQAVLVAFNWLLHVCRPRPVCSEVPGATQPVLGTSPPHKPSLKLPEDSKIWSWGIPPRGFQAVSLG